MNIGNTPLVELVNIEKHFYLESKIFAKLESYNPGGSIKDRAALYMIEDAEKKSLLKSDSVIIEPTSGNTGIGLALIGKLKGYRVLIVMPDSMSIERRQMIASHGAELVLTPGKEGMKGAIAKAKELLNEYPNSFMPMQFDNPSNVRAHYEGTGPEIYKQRNEKVDVFIAGVGTGGTVTGAGRYLKEQNKDIRVIAVEPEDSPVLSKGVAGPHKIQGIGAGFVPSILDTSIYDEIMPISNDDAFKFGRLVRELDNVSCGISSGAALAAAVKYAEKHKGKNIVVIFPDGGDRYLSTPLFEKD